MSLTFNVSCHSFFSSRFLNKPKYHYVVIFSRKKKTWMWKILSHRETGTKAWALDLEIQSQVLSYHLFIAWFATNYLTSLRLSSLNLLNEKNNHSCLTAWVLRITENEWKSSSHGLSSSIPLARPQPFFLKVPHLSCPHHSGPLLLLWTLLILHSVACIHWIS